MFGMDDKKSGKAEKVVFDLEEEVSNPLKWKEKVTHVQEKLSVIKQLAREGGTPEDARHLGILLNGYSSLVKVLARMVAK